MKYPKRNSYILRKTTKSKTKYRKSYFTFLIFLITVFASQNISAQIEGEEYYQIESIFSFEGGGTYELNDAPNDLVLELLVCLQGIDPPDPNSIVLNTFYTITWYVNSSNSTTGGTSVSSNFVFTDGGDPNNPSTINAARYVPSTNTAGTFYYYAVLSDPEISLCGFTDPIISTTQEVIINDDTLGIDSFDTDITYTIFPNPSSDFVEISGLKNTEDYKIYTVLGTEVRKGKISNNEKLNIQNLKDGLYFILFDNNKIFKFSKK